MRTFNVIRKVRLIFFIYVSVNRDGLASVMVTPVIEPYDWRFSDDLMLRLDILCLRL